ncbi:MAG TPA: prepilin-type N-terminal cleavage/methylation domain-containing protein [Polyangiales bacterium]|nr:prepilin-type N-terminal cleavage/methylation domain-containing protein [Polyangiales bacterium]
MKRRERAAFTLIELLVVVAVMGILSALAIPTFRTVLMRSKTGEASANLSQMFKAAAVYYTQERASQGQDGSLVVGCTVGGTGPVPLTPGVQKQPMPADPEFRALGFYVAEYVYYSYGLIPEGTGSACGNGANDSTVYTLYAQGDLDGDSIFSNFELAVGSDQNNELFHARGFYVEHELE